MKTPEQNSLQPWQEIAISALTNNLKITLKTSLHHEGKKNEYHTEIDLTRGINNKLSGDNLGENNQVLIKFHHQELAKIHDTWQKNRDTIEKAIQILQGEKIELTQRPSPSIIESQEENNFSLPENEEKLVTENTFVPTEIENNSAEDDLSGDDLFSDEDENSNEKEVAENWLDQDNIATNELEEKEEIIYTAEEMEDNKIETEATAEDWDNLMEDDEIETEDTAEDWDNLMEDDEETPDNETESLNPEWQQWLGDEEIDGEEDNL